MELPNVFESADYKTYLRATLKSSGEGRGRRTKLAEALGCRAGFVSQVLNGDSHFSLEHGVQVAEFLGLKGAERDYFLLLLHHGKAGSVSLRRHYEAQMRSLAEERREIRSRVSRTHALQEGDFATYYGNWTYALVHMALSVPKYRSLSALSNAFRIPEPQVRAVVRFLEERGLIARDGDGFKTGPTRLHLPRDAPLIGQHHLNWRMEAVKSLAEPFEGDMHYSSVLTMSKRDAQKIREVLLRSLSEVETILGPSPNEEVYSLGLDFFGMGVPRSR